MTERSGLDELLEETGETEAVNRAAVKLGISEQVKHQMALRGDLGA